MSRSSFAVAIAMAALATGCASMGDTRTSQATPAARAGTVEEDTQYMARIERQARARGVDVTWINPPLRRRASTP